jgi:hypothetical protein
VTKLGAPELESAWVYPHAGTCVVIDELLIDHAIAGLFIM